MKKTVLLILMIFIGISSGDYAEARSKIAVASEGSDAASSISAKAARAPFFLIFDDQGKIIEVLENHLKDDAKGVGVSVVDLLVQKDVTVLIAETFGNKTINALKEKGIKYYEFEGNVAEAVKKVIKIK